MSRKVVPRAPDLGVTLRMQPVTEAAVPSAAGALTGLLWYFEDMDEWSAQPQTMDVFYPATYTNYAYRESPAVLTPDDVMARVWGASGKVRWVARWRDGKITLDQVNNPGAPQDFTDNPPRINVRDDSVVIGGSLCIVVDNIANTTRFTCPIVSGVLEVSAIDDAGTAWGPITLVVTGGSATGYY